MRKLRIITGLGVLLFSFSYQNSAHAWANHYLITRMALEKDQRLKSEMVEYRSFDELLKSLGFNSTVQFNESIEIRKNYVFKEGLGEKTGDFISLLDVLAHYSDEPDWGMDIELFEKDQYPDLWRDEYAMMGGNKKGTPSQAHRHMYWGKLSLTRPIKTFHFPKPFKPLGISPERAELFLELSRKAKDAGHEYWAARFLSNALHYIEDISSPFHSTQLPSKKFALRAMKEGKKSLYLKNFISRTTDVVTYYHFAFEDMVGDLLLAEVMGKSQNFKKQNLGNIFTALRSDNSDHDDLDYGKNPNLREIFMGLHRASEKSSTMAANASIGFFPPLPDKLDGFDVRKFMDKQWWGRVSASFEKPSSKKQMKSKDRIFRSVRQMFAPVGVVIRSIVKEEI